MTQLERLVARITQLIKENPNTVIDLSILAGIDGHPRNWFIRTINKVEGFLSSDVNWDKLETLTKDRSE